MFKCLDCRKIFDEPKHSVERHGLSNPPFEDRYICPNCSSTSYKPLVKDEISRREVLSKLIDVMRALNEFELRICGAFSSTALESTEFESARDDLYKLMTVIAGDAEFDLPKNIDEKIFEMCTSVQTAAVYEILTANVEE